MSCGLRLVFKTVAHAVPNPSSAANRSSRQQPSRIVIVSTVNVGSIGWQPAFFFTVARFVLFKDHIQDTRYTAQNEPSADRSAVSAPAPELDGPALKNSYNSPRSFRSGIPASQERGQGGSVGRNFEEVAPHNRHQLYKEMWCPAG
jgi:hypothetical protein